MLKPTHVHVYIFQNSVVTLSSQYGFSNFLLLFFFSFLNELVLLGYDVMLPIKT